MKRQNGYTHIIDKTKILGNPSLPGALMGCGSTYFGSARLSLLLLSDLASPCPSFAPKPIANYSRHTASPDHGLQDTLPLSRSPTCEHGSGTALSPNQQEVVPVDRDLHPISIRIISNREKRKMLGLQGNTIVKGHR